MIAPFLLVSIGLILILLEFYLPGAIMAVLGSVFILSGIILFTSQTSSILTIVGFIVGVVIAIIWIIRFALWRIVHTKPRYSIYSDNNQEGYQASFYDKSTIGKVGEVVADLKPGGFILIEGEQHSAISMGGYLAKGEKVIVIGGQEQSLLVKKYNEQERFS